MDEAVKIGTMIFAASPSDDLSIAAAKEYITKNEFTADDVKMVKSQGYIGVIAKKEILLRI